MRPTTQLRCGLLLAAALLLAGCSSQGTNQYQQYLRLLGGMWNGQEQSVTLAEASAIPYASIGVRVGSGPQALLIMGSDTHGVVLWTSASHAVVVTESGRITKTAGFPKNLAGTTTSKPRLPLVAGTRARYTERYLIDLPDMNAYGATVTCNIAPVGPEFVAILGKQIRTVHMEENCAVETIDWSFTNQYWVSVDSGLVWRSVQYIHPKMDPLEIVILRPPG